MSFPTNDGLLPTALCCSFGAPTIRGKFSGVKKDVCSLFFPEEHFRDCRYDSPLQAGGDMRSSFATTDFTRRYSYHHFSFTWQKT